MDRKEKEQEKKKKRPSTRKKQTKTVKRTVSNRAAKKIESELAHVDEKLHKMSDLLGDLPQGICFFNKEGVIKYCNESFGTITGFNAEALKGKKLRKNQLWGGRGAKDEFSELFQQARETGSRINADRMSINSSKAGERIWNINLIPQKDESADYDGMELIIEDVTGLKPAPGDSLSNALFAASVQHTEMQPLLDSLVTVLRDYCGYTSVKLIVVDRMRNRAYKADSDSRAGLWDTDGLLSPAELDNIFKNAETLGEEYLSSGGSIYLRNISECEKDLTGLLKDIVVNSSNSYGFCSMTLIPIRHEGWLQGFIQIANTRGEIQLSTISMIEDIRNQLQVILEHAGLKDEMRTQREGLLKQMNERNAHLEAMSEHLKQEVAERKKAQEEMRVQRDLALALNQIDDLDEALSLCLDTAIRVTGMDSGGIYLLDKNTKELVLASAKGLSPEFRENVTRYNRDVMDERFIHPGNPLYITAGEIEGVMAERLFAEGIKGIGFIPIKFDNDLVALLNVASHEFAEITYTARNAVEAIAAEIGTVLTRIRNRQAFTESEERYKTLFARSLNPILVVDEDGKYIDGNDAALEFLECTREELLAMTVKDTLPPYLDDEWYEKYRAFWLTSGTVERDYYVWGKIKVMELTITPLQMGERKVFFGICTDITEKKRIENELKASEERYRSHFNNVNDVIYSIDSELKVTSVSPSVERILGYKPEEIIGKSIHELPFVDRPNLEKGLSNINRIYNGEVIEAVEYQFRKKNGEIIYAEISGAPLYKDGKLAGAVSVARDVTDHKKAEEAVRKSEEKYRTILEEMDESYYEVDAKGNFMDANEAMARRLGYTRNEIIGLNYKDISRKEDYSGKIAAFSRVFQTGRPRFWQPIIGLKKDGGLIYMEDSVYPLRNEQGEIIGLRGIGRDVTERRLWEAALKESEEKFRRLFFQSPVGVAIVSLDDYRFVSVNEALCNFSGYTDEELVTKKVGDITHPDYISVDRENIERLIKGEIDNYVTDEQYIRKDGSAIWGHVSVRLIKDPAGNPLYLLPVIEDITARKKAEKTLSTTEAMFKSIIEHITDIFYIQDANRNLLYISPQVESTLGFTVEEMMGGWQVSLTNNPINMAGQEKSLLALRTGEKQDSYLLEFRDKSGRTFLAEINESPLKDENGNVTGLVGAARDVTMQHAAEEEIRASEKRYQELAYYNQQLNEIYLELIEARSSEELVNRIAESLNALTGAADVAISKYDAKSGMLKLQAGSTGKILETKAEGMLGIKLADLEFRVPDEILAQMLSEPINHTQDLSLVTFGAITQEQSAEIMQTAGWVAIVVLSLSYRHELAGTAFAFIPAGAPVVPDDVLKTFAYMAGVAMSKKRDEDELIASEEKFKSIAEHIEEVFFIQDEDSKFLYMSSQALKIFGYAQDEFNEFWEQKVSDFGMNKDAVRNREAAIKTGQKQPPYTCDFIRKDGITIAIEVNETPLLDGEGKFKGFVGVVRDVTERKAIEQALIESEAKFRNIIETSPDPIWEVDPSGVFTYLSPRMKDAMGYDSAEMLGKPIFSIIKPDKVDEVAQKLLEAQQSGVSVYSTQVEAVTKDGMEIVLEIRSAQVLDQQGNLRGFRGLSHDVTEQIRFEKALQESEGKYRSVVEGASEGIFVLQEGRFKYANERLISFSSYTRDELRPMLQGDPFKEIIHPDDLNMLTETYYKRLHGEQVPSQYEVRWLDKGRVTRWASINVTSINWEGKPATLGFVTDVTERKKMEEALAASEEKYRTVLDEMDEFYYEVDSKGNYTFVNNAAERIYGYTREEMTGMNYKVVTPREQYKERIIDAGGVYTTGKPLYWKPIEHIKKDGSHIFLETSILPLRNNKGEIIGIRGISRDITARIRFEKALRESEDKHRTVLEEMDEFYYELDPSGKFTFVNEAAEAVFGYSVEELIGLDYKVYTPPEDIRRRVAAFTEVFETGKARSSILLEHIRKDGTRVIVDCSIVPLRNDAGEIVGLRGVGKDVTERIRAEEELTRRSLLLDSAYDSIIAYGLDGNIFYANESACSSRGYTREEMLQMNVSMLVPESGRAKLAERFTLIGQHNELIFEAMHMHKDGTLFPVEAYTRLIKQADKDIVIAVYRDIALRRQSEQALKESEARFRDMAEMLPLVIYEADLRGRFTYINKHGLDTFGYTMEEILDNFEVYNLLDNAGVNGAKANLLRILNGEKVDPQEYLLVRKDGTRFEGIVYSSRILRADGVKGFRGVMVDISTLKKAEKTIVESEGKYRSVVENAGEAIFIAQEDRLTFANDRMVELTGYSRDELFAAPFIELIHPDDRELIGQRYLARLRGDPVPNYYTFRAISRDGVVKTIGLRATTILWGDKPATLNFALDVTEIVKAENDLKESEQRYRLLADNSMDIIITTNLEMEVTYISPSVRYMIGQTAEAILKMYHDETLTAEILGLSETDAERSVTVMRALVDDPSRTQVFELEFKHPDGFTSWAEVKMSIMRDKAGQAVGILAVIRDVTQQKKITERLIRSDRLASLGEMAAGLAHEVNNPLTAVMGFAYLVLQNPNTPPEVKNDINSIYNEGKRAADVIKNFLLFARGRKPEKQAVFINDIIESTLRLRHSQMTKENITVLLNLAEDLPAINGDVSQLQQVFLNIVLNAEHFMYQSNKKGTLAITTNSEEGRIKIYLADDGPGIPPDKIDRIFDPFYTTKQVGEGTGLGLSICHGIISEHGGNIYAESKPGAGATFIIDLPEGK